MNWPEGQVTSMPEHPSPKEESESLKHCVMPQRGAPGQVYDRTPSALKVLESQKIVHNGELRDLRFL